MVLRWVLLLALSVHPQAQTKRIVLPDVKPVRVSELKERIMRDSGKVVLVNVWATWCKPCKEEMPQLVRLRKNVSRNEFSLILVSADDSELVDTKVRPALKSLGVDFPSYIINERSDEAFMNGMDSTWNGALPTTFVYDWKGKLSKIMTGERTYKQFEEVVGKLLAR